MHRSIIALLFLLLVSSPPTPAGQDSLVSPVFKRYRPPRPATLLEESDITYQLWQTFNLTQKANRGDVLAMQELAVRYLIGKGVKADTARGAYWTARAAEKNLQPARFNMGILLASGWGVEWNPFEAFHHFLYCARRGMPEAQYVIATFYTEDLVVPRDIAVAERWLTAAADSGYAPAGEMLAVLRKEVGSPAAADSGARTDTPPKNGESRTSPIPPTSLGWSPVFLEFGSDTTRAVEEGTLLGDLVREAPPELLSSLGIRDSISTIGDLDSSARATIERAADAGSPEALTLLGRAFELGTGITTDRVRAVACYLRAVRVDALRAPRLLQELLEREGVAEEIRKRMLDGDPVAGFCVATLTGLGIADPLIRSNNWIGVEEGFRLLQEASQRGYTPATIELGLWYYAGRGTAPDASAAQRRWREAAARGSLEAEIRAAAAEIQEAGAEPAVDLFARGVREGSVLAQVALGLCHESGRGVRRNTGEAATLYRSAARRGSQDGYRALLRLHDAIRPPDRMFQLSVP